MGRIKTAAVYWERSIMNERRIEALIFDLGGTLYHPAADLIDVAREHLVQAGVHGCEDLSDETIEEALLVERNGWLNQYMIEQNVEPHWEPSRDLWIKHDRRFLEAICVEGDVEKLAVAYQDLWDAKIAEFNYELVEGTKAALERFQSYGLYLSVASNRFGDPSRYLENDGIKDMFEYIEYSAVPGYMKPSPYMLLRVASLMGVNPLLCAYVGNSVKYDVAAAKAADMHPVLLTWCDPEEKERAPPDITVIDHLDELEEHLNIPR